MKVSNKIVTCPYCKEQLNKEDAVIHKRRYYHSECLEQKEKEEEEKRRESEDYKELINYICQLYNLDAPTGMILKQIKEFREEYGYKLQGIKLSLQYFYEIQGNPVLDDVGIGIVPFVYEEAKRHYITRLNVERSLENYKKNDIQHVYVDLNRKKTKHKNLIDISSL